MNLTSILSTAAGGWIPWAATAATKLAGNFSSMLGSAAAAPESAEAVAAPSAPEFPLSSSDRDRLERLLDEDLQSLANLLRANPAHGLDENSTIDLALDSAGNSQAMAVGSDGESRALDLSGSEEMSSLLRRMASCLQRLAPSGESSGQPSSPSQWQIRVDRAGARLVEGL